MKYFIIAGEASGDLHASRLMRELKNNDNHAQFMFMGGDLMADSGGTMVQHYKNMAFMGVINVLLNIKKINKNFDICKNAITSFNPDVIILVDYPGFNLRIAKWIKESNLKYPIHYYIAPKLWAWKSYRIKSIRKYVDKMYTIFPFETEYFKNLGYEVNFVGNPCVDAIRDAQNSKPSKNEFISKYKLDNRPIIALLAGSRKQEIKGCIKKMSNVAKHYPNYQFIIAGAPNIKHEFYNSLTEEDFKIISNNTYNLLAFSHAAIVNSGTATLETALIGTPQVVVYHVFGGIIASWLKKFLLHIKFVSLVNLIGEKEVVRELIAHEFTCENLHRELDLIVNNDIVRSHIENEYKIIQSKLGNNNTAEVCAKLIIETLN